MEKHHLILFYNTVYGAPLDHSIDELPQEFHNGIYLGYKDLPHKDSTSWKVSRWEKNTKE